MPQVSSSPKSLADRAKIADVLAGLLRKTYGDGVEIVTRGWTVTISRGKRAAQVQVLDTDRFLVALRRNQTFHMQRDPADREKMVGLVDKMVGERIQSTG